jgi:hypothetical protein
MVVVVEVWLAHYSFIVGVGHIIIIITNNSLDLCAFLHLFQPTITL